MPTLQVDKIRRRVWHSISPCTADGLTQAQLQQFIAGTPSDIQLTRLARYLGVPL